MKGTRARDSSVVTPRAAVAAPSRADRLWDVEDVAAYLGVPVGTLYQWRYRGVGPTAFRVGKHLRYDPALVRDWLLAQTA